ncbi:unnamed protein product [Zymoseptoria tritici ST99CH_1A5]|uniref:Uncharacterized protein n=1 Tax=Zymoseptoria tritici ST99CH_1A5 TaxID=1276529 RepID=A0A1Y6LCE4_ZYMTR|nr:unnamed protein product [Zymoseptoria tritici ST99CH_1A5]
MQSASMASAYSPATKTTRIWTYEERQAAHLLCYQFRLPVPERKRIFDILFGGDNSGRAIRSQGYEHKPREGVKRHADWDRICATPRTVEDEATRDRLIDEIRRLKDEGATLHTPSGSGTQHTAPPTAPSHVSTTGPIGASAGLLNEASPGSADVLRRDDRDEVPQHTTVGEGNSQQHLTGENHNNFDDGHPSVEVNTSPATAILAHVHTAVIIQHGMLSAEMTRFDLQSMALDLQPDIFPYIHAREVAETLVGGRYVSFHDPSLSPDERADTRAPWVLLAVSVALDLRTWNRVCIREHCRVCSR